MVKKRSPQMIIFWFFFSCISLIFWSTISHLSFLGLWLLNFFRMLLTFFLEMVYKKHNIFFCWEGQKRFFGFFKKTVLFLKKERKHKN